MTSSQEKAASHTASASPTWPTHADGSPKTMGEMTDAEQLAQFAAMARGSNLSPEQMREIFRKSCEWKASRTDELVSGEPK